MKNKGSSIGAIAILLVMVLLLSAVTNYYSIQSIRQGESTRWSGWNSNRTRIGPKNHPSDTAAVSGSQQSTAQEQKPEREQPVKDRAPIEEPEVPFREGAELDVYFLDVGQGASVVLSCEDEVMIIDGGAADQSSKVYAFLQSHEFDELKYVFASHADADHAGGLAGALNYAEPGRAFCAQVNGTSSAFDNFVKYLGDTPLEVPMAGDIFYLGCAKVTVLYPKISDTRLDNTSLVLRVDFGDVSFLFPGDCEEEDELLMLDRNLDLSSDVLYVAHHGSSSSTKPDFLEAVNPRTAVISVGAENTYGHPTETVLNALQARGVELYRTDLQGDITCHTDGHQLHFSTENTRSADVFAFAGGFGNAYAAQELLPMSDKQETQENANSGAGSQYLVNLRSERFHYPGCEQGEQMLPQNRLEFSGTRDELIAKGYEPCKVCNP